MGKWYELNAEKTSKLIIVAILIFAAFVALQVWANQLHIEVLPEETQPVFVALVTFMTAGGTTFAISLGRNVVGYLRNYLETEYTEAYDQKRLYNTWLYYFGIIGTVLTAVETIAVPPPWREAVLAITTLVALVADFMLSEIKKPQEKHP